MRAALRILFVFVALALGAGAAAAQSKEDRARALHAEGLAHYKAGRYDEAIASYRAAYELVPAPGILFNLAQAHRLAGHCAKALELYRRYLDEDPGAKNAAVVNENIEAMKTCVARRRAKAKEAPESSDPTAADKPLGPASGEVRSRPPSATGPDAAVPFTSKPLPPPGDGGDPGDPGRTKRLLGFGLAAGGAVALGVGVYFGLQARSASSEIDQFFRDGGVWDDEHRALEDRGKRDNSLMIGFTAAGAAAVGIGVVSYVLGRQGGEAPPASMAVVPTRGGAALSFAATY